MTFWNFNCISFSIVDLTRLATTGPHNSNLGILSCLDGAILFLEHSKWQLTDPPDNSHLIYATAPYALPLPSQKKILALDGPLQLMVLHICEIPDPPTETSP